VIQQASALLEDEARLRMSDAAASDARLQEAQWKAHCAGSKTLTRTDVAFLVQR
jgi:hypothetical protein